jgi:hypothetical protein
VKLVQGQVPFIDVLERRVAETGSGESGTG